MVLLWYSTSTHVHCADAARAVTGNNACLVVDTLGARTTAAVHIGLGTNLHVTLTVIKDGSTILEAVGGAIPLTKRINTFVVGGAARSDCALWYNVRGVSCG
jgi:hypothetical protein